MSPLTELAPSPPEIIDRRTDDILFNIRHLGANILDRDQGLFVPEAETDILEQDVTDVSEADIHKFAPTVYQELDDQRQQYITLDIGTLDNAIKGVTELNMDDSASEFEFYRRVEEVTDEETPLQPEVNARMRAGEKKVFVSAEPTADEADPDVASSFGYDGRTMLRIQSLSADGRTKEMQSFSLFKVPAEAWAQFFADRYDEVIKPTALAVMQFCNRVILEEGDTADILKDFIDGVSKYVDTDDRLEIERQLDSFLHEQAELKEKASYYAGEKLALEKELALSLDSWARPAVLNIVNDAYEHLTPQKQEILTTRFYGNQLLVDNEVAKIVISLKTVTVDNRAGLATLNERTLTRVASKIGLESALELAIHEQYIQALGPNNGSEFMIRRSEQQIFEAGVGCGGGCSVEVVDLFSAAARAAREAGLGSTLYASSELDHNSKCNCGKKAKVISDGKNVVCATCGEFQVKGKRGNIKAA